MWNPFRKIAARALAPLAAGAAPNAVYLPVKPPAKHQSRADWLDWACKQYKGTYEREVKNGKVVLRFITDDGDTVISGSGSTTVEAVTALRAKLEATK